MYIIITFLETIRFFHERSDLNFFVERVTKLASRQGRPVRRAIHRAHTAGVPRPPEGVRQSSAIHSLEQTIGRWCAH